MFNAIVAALCSKNLEQFFYSDCYLREHLNPEWLPKKINKICIPLPNYIEIGHWSNGDENQELLLTYQLQGFADINQSSPAPMPKRANIQLRRPNANPEVGHINKTNIIQYQEFIFFWF